LLAVLLEETQMTEVLAVVVLVVIGHLYLENHLEVVQVQKAH
jgi:hypothetical protein